MLKRLLNCIVSFFRNIKWVWQRITRGYSDKDLWSFDDTIAKFMLPRLKEFKKHIYGYPSCLKSIDKWKEILDKIIFSFEHAQRMYLPLESDTREFKEKYDDFNARYDEGMRLFAKYFSSLWN